MIPRRPAAPAAWPTARARSALASVAAVATLGVSAGCADWLDMPSADAGPSARAVATSQVANAYLPTARARADAAGPLVPGTPGFRVPAGYFTRVRLDVEDLFLPYSYAAFLTSEHDVALRVVALGSPARDRGEGGSKPPAPPVLRAVIPLPVPDRRGQAAGLGTLMGLTLGADALRGSTATLRLSDRDLYLLTLTRFTLESSNDAALSFSLEGTARRGSMSKASLPFQIGVVGLRAPTVGVRR